jgi:hypothetical protein
MKLKLKNGILLVAIVLLLNLSMITTPGLGQAYDPKPNQSYVYEVKYSLYPYNYPDTSKRDQTNTSLVRVDISNVEVGRINGTTNPTETSGVITYTISAMILGQNWVVYEREKLWAVNSSIPGVYGNVGFVDGQITIAQIVAEFASAPILKPNASLSDNSMVYYKNRFEGNIQSAFMSSTTPTAQTNETAIWIESFVAFGDSPTIDDFAYSIQIVFKDHILESYSIRSVDRPQHIVFSAQRIYQDLTFPEQKSQIDGFNLGIVALCTLLGISIFIKRKNLQ